MTVETVTIILSMMWFFPSFLFVQFLYSVLQHYFYFQILTITVSQTPTHTLNSTAGHAVDLLVELSCRNGARNK